MKLSFLATSALALVLAPAPAIAQHTHHPEPPRVPKEAPPPVPKEAPPPVPEQAPPTAPKEAPPAAPKEIVDHSAMGHGPAAPLPERGHTGALGPYPMSREASGTAWQPDSAAHMGAMFSSGDWSLMGHATLNLVYDHQGGQRGDDKIFASGMVMGMARHPLGNGAFQLKAALSPDPLMGKRGYPLLLASGETANGADRLIDRQHPHDFFMELGASVSQNIGAKSSVFLYAGLPGEPAFGPPPFMHREPVLDSPEAPISHHWLDSTHITFGVVTAGLVLDRFKIEASRFNGREPDEHRWNIETAPLDSTAVRLSWNPSSKLALQGSWGRFTDPEQLEPGVDQKRWSASALYSSPIGNGWKLSGTLAWGRKTAEGHSDDAFVAEAGLQRLPWTLFARAEMTENRELFDTEEHGSAYRVGKFSFGGVHDILVQKHAAFGVGALASLNFVPEGLRDDYGSGNPVGAMGFVRLKIH